MLETCETCEGCGKLANTKDREPWSRWLQLPVRSAVALQVGIVTPITCPDCQGAGKVQQQRFPIQRAGTVPWKEAEIAYRAYSSFFSKDQTLERLAQRGGFGIGEFCCLYVGKNPFSQHTEEIEKAIVVVAMELKDDWIL